MGVKFSVNEKFFDTWSDQMAYVLGYFYADGHLSYVPSMRGKYVVFTSTDRDRIECFRKLFESGHQTLEIQRDGNRKIIYQLRIGSAVLYDKLLTFGLTPNKSSKVLFPNVPIEYLSPFVRGYFDGDGCAFLERSKSGNAKKLLSIFTCGSKKFLEALHEALVLRIGIQGTRIYKHGSTEGTYQIRYSTRNSLRLFLFMYGVSPPFELYLERKYAIFSEYLRIRDLAVENIPHVLKTKGPVVK